MELGRHPHAWALMCTDMARNITARACTVCCPLVLCLCCMEALRGVAHLLPVLWLADSPQVGHAVAAWRGLCREACKSEVQH